MPSKLWGYKDICWERPCGSDCDKCNHVPGTFGETLYKINEEVENIGRMAERLNDTSSNLLKETENLYNAIAGEMGAENYMGEGVPKPIKDREGADSCSDDKEHSSGIKDSASGNIRQSDRPELPNSVCDCLKDGEESGRYLDIMLAITRLMNMLPEGGAYSVKECDIHISEDLFRKMFKTYNTLERESYKYPYEYFNTVNGIRIFCIGD